MAVIDDMAWSVKEVELEDCSKKGGIKCVFGMA